MGRPKKIPVADVVAAAPRVKPKVAPRPPDHKRRVAEINAREAENKRRAGATVRCDFKVPLLRKEAYLDLAERHGEELSTVLRACVEYGYQYYTRFVAVADGGPSPFIPGQMGMGAGAHEIGQPRPSQTDPRGDMWPPAPLPQVFGRPVIPDDRPFAVVRGQPPPQRESYSTVTEDVFGSPNGRVLVNGRDVPMAGILPSSGETPRPETASPEPTFEPPAPETPMLDLVTSAEEPQPAATFAFGATEEPVAAE